VPFFGNCAIFGATLYMDCFFMTGM